MQVRSLSPVNDPGEQQSVLTSAAALLQDLLSAGSVERAIGAALTHASGGNDRIAAAWFSGDEPERLPFLGARGLSAPSVAALRDAVPSLPRWAELGGDERARVRASFRAITGAVHDELVDAGDAILVIGSSAAVSSFASLGRVLDQAIRYQREREMLRLRIDRMDDGVAIAAHELRRPLLGTKAVIECLLQGKIDGERGIALLRQSHRELAELSATLESLAHWSVEGATDLELRPVELTALVERVVDASRDESPDIRVKVTSPGEVLVSADPVPLGEAIATVVRWAIRHSPQGKEVRIRVATARGHATVSVSDRGPGLSASDQMTLFDPFTGARGPRRASALDLFVVKRVIEAHGGRIWASGNGTGATFNIELAAALDEARAGAWTRLPTRATTTTA